MTTTRSIRSFGRFGLGAVCALLMAGPALAADVTLKLGWTGVDEPTQPYAITAHAFERALETVAPGVFEVKLYPNHQLGDEKEMVEGLKFGTIDMGLITNSVVANVAPAFQLNDMPFLYADSQQAYDVLDGEIGQELMAGLERQGIIGLGFADGGFRHMINNVRPIAHPEDATGIKFRVMQNPVFIGIFDSIGASPVPMAWGELFTAVQQGAVDGAEMPASVAYANKYQEVVKYLSLTGHTFNAVSFLMSERSYGKLDEEQQGWLREAAALAIAEQRVTSAEVDREIVERIRETGIEVNEISDPAEFRATVTGVYESFEDEIGSDLMARALAQVSGN